MNQATHQDVIIDFGELLSALFKRLPVIILVAALCASAGFCYSKLYVTPLYRASALMMVSSGSRSSEYITSDQLSTSASLIDLYSIVINSNAVMDEVYEAVQEQGITGAASNISVSAVDDTQVMRITVTSTSAEYSLAVCQEIVNIAPEKFVDMVGPSSAKILSEASVSSISVTQDVKSSTLKAGAFGGAAACAVVLLLALLDNRVRKSDLQQMSIPLLGAIPPYEQN